MPKPKKKQADMQKRIFPAVRQGQGWEGLRTDLRRQGLAQIDALPEEQRKQLGDPNAYLDRVIDGQLKMPQSRWFKYFLDLDPAPYFEKVRCPVFGAVRRTRPAGARRRQQSGHCRRIGE